MYVIVFVADEIDDFGFEFEVEQVVAADFRGDFEMNAHDFLIEIVFDEQAALGGADLEFLGDHALFADGDAGARPVAGDDARSGEHIGVVGLFKRVNHQRPAQRTEVLDQLQRIGVVERGIKSNGFVAEKGVDGGCGGDAAGGTQGLNQQVGVG